MSGGRSVGIVCSRTQATEFVFCFYGTQMFIVRVVFTVTGQCALSLLTWMPPHHHNNKTNKRNSMVWVCERTIPTERPPLVGEVIANFCG
jgi:hypothetical protein